MRTAVALAAAALSGAAACSTSSDTSACRDAYRLVQSLTGTLADLRGGTATAEDIAPTLQDEANRMDSIATDAKSPAVTTHLQATADDIRRLRVDYIEGNDTTTDGQTLIDDLHAIGPTCDRLLH